MTDTKGTCRLYVHGNISAFLEWRTRGDRGGQAVICASSVHGNKSKLELSVYGNISGRGLNDHGNISRLLSDRPWEYVEHTPRRPIYRHRLPHRPMIRCFDRVGERGFCSSTCPAYCPSSVHGNISELGNACPREHIEVETCPSIGTCQNRGMHVHGNMSKTRPES